MLKMQITVDTSRFMDLVRNQLPKAIPYVQATTATNLAKRVQAKVREQLPVKFDRPTPYTVRGVFIKAADRQSPVAEVFFPDSTEQRGLPKREYLRPGAFGAPRRNQKRTEFLLTRTGFLPPGWVTTPGTSALKYGYMDTYGNVKPRVYAQIVNVLQLKQMGTGRNAKGISAASAKRAARMGVDAEFFAVRPGANTLGRGGSWLPAGVYKRVGPKGDQLHQLLKFVSKASYQQRLDLETIARNEVNTGLKAEFDRAFASVRERFRLRDQRTP